jgi:hypothetical protein
MQRHVDSGREPAGRRDAPVVDEAQAAAQFDLREFLRERIPEVVMRRRRDAVQQPDAGELERAGADGHGHVGLGGRGP